VSNKLNLSKTTRKMKTTRKSVSKKSSKSKNFNEKDLKDLQVLEEIKSGKVNAYEFIYERYYKFIQYHCFMSIKDQQIAHDLATEILTKVYLNIDKYKTQYTFNSWVWSIVRNHLVDHVRKSKLEPVNHNLNSLIQSFESNDSENYKTLTVHYSDLSSDDQNPEEIVQDKNIDNARKEFVKNLLGNISEKERMILVHYYFDDMSYEEIAEKLDIGLSSMKVTLMRAKEKLKNRIGSKNNIAHLFTVA
jgi:RNA polymerase sigma-70 factor (ECF subfamily)